MEVQGIPESALVQEVSRPLYEARNWLKLIGITMIVFSAFGIIGLLIYFIIGTGSSLSDYLPGATGYMLGTLLVSLIPIGLSIWQSVMLIQAGSAATAAGLNGDKTAMIRALSSLKTYFIIIGVLLIIGIVIFFFSICASIFLVAAGPSILNSFEGVLP